MKIGLWALKAKEKQRERNSAGKGLTMASTALWRPRRGWLQTYFGQYSISFSNYNLNVFRWVMPTLTLCGFPTDLPSPEGFWVRRWQEDAGEMAGGPMLCQGRVFQTSHRGRLKFWRERVMWLKRTLRWWIWQWCVRLIEHKEVGFKKSTFPVFPCSLWHQEFYPPTVLWSVSQFGPVLCSLMFPVVAFLTQALEVWGCVLYLLCVTPCTDPGQAVHGQLFGGSVLLLWRRLR